jgi:hypothetical protein
MNAGAAHAFLAQRRRAAGRRARRGRPLSGWAKRFAEARYMKIHLDPADAEEARRLAARLGWTKLGAGLQPVGGF